MKTFLLALENYLKDCYHDKLIKEAKDLDCKLQDKIAKYNAKTGKITTNWKDAEIWKKGSVWYYYKLIKANKKD